MTDKNGAEIRIGDILDSDDGYSVIVRVGKDSKWYGELVCQPNHPRADAHYALNNGEGYTIWFSPLLLPSEED